MLGELPRPTSNDFAIQKKNTSTRIDALLLSHPFTDHSHPETLGHRGMPENIPMLVTTDAKHALPKQVIAHRTVIELEDAHKFSPSVSRSEHVQHTTCVVPDNVQILQARPMKNSRALLRTPADAASQKLHGGIIILWQCDDSDAKMSTKAIFYAPHGADPSSVPAWLRDESIDVTAFFTSFDRITLPRWLAGTVNLGLPGALEILAKPGKESGFRTRYLIDTHSEMKASRGLVARMLKRYNLGDAGQEVNDENMSGREEREHAAQQKIDQSCYGGTQVMLFHVGDTHIL